MSLTNPPAVIQQLSDQLAACASWTGGAAANWYPDATGVLTTHAVLVEADHARQVYAEGARAIPSGTLKILLYVADTIGNTEALARTLCDELSNQYTGLPIRSIRTGICTDPGPSNIAAGDVLKATEISIDYGLSA